MAKTATFERTSDGRCTVKVFKGSRLIEKVTENADDKLLETLTRKMKYEKTVGVSEDSAVFDKKLLKQVKAELKAGFSTDAKPPKYPTEAFLRPIGSVDAVKTLTQCICKVQIKEIFALSMQSPVISR